MDIFSGLIFCQCLMLTLAATDCPNPLECTCAFDLLDCSGRGLINVPRFAPSYTVFQTLRLDHNRLSNIPNSIGINVSNIVLRYNRINSIDDRAFYGVEDRLNELDLSHNNLVTIPASIRTLQHLLILDLSANSIRTIERNDFTNMRILTNLTLSENPLIIIAPDAFIGMYSLTYLNLQNTMLTEMPEAIANTPQQRVIIVPTDQIMCTCDLVWLKKYMVSIGHQLHIQGTCETIISTIEYYLSHFISMCPGSNLIG